MKDVDPWLLKALKRGHEGNDNTKVLKEREAIQPGSTFSICMHVKTCRNRCKARQESLVWVVMAPRFSLNTSMGHRIEFKRTASTGLASEAF